MGTDKGTIERLLSALAPIEPVARAMFGEYGLYVDGRMAAMVCDDTLFVKATDAGRAIAPSLTEGMPYPGAKPALRIEAADWNADWLPDLLTATAAVLPAPKPRRKKS